MDDDSADIEIDFSELDPNFSSAFVQRLINRDFVWFPPPLPPPPLQPLQWPQQPLLLRSQQRLPGPLAPQAFPAVNPAWHWLSQRVPNATGTYYSYSTRPGVSAPHNPSASSTLR